MAKKASDTGGLVVIEAANIVVATVRVQGTAPYVQARFSKRGDVMAGMSEPRAQRKGKNARAPRDFDADFVGAQHRFGEGGHGQPTSAYVSAMVAACRTVGMMMTHAKAAGIKVRADGVDVEDGTPLVRLVSPRPPERSELAVRNANGSIDIRVRPMWREWYADLRIEYDADMITATSVVNLLDRAGRQIGIGEGRPFSKNSTGMGWGTFTVVQEGNS